MSALQRQGLLYSSGAAPCTQGQAHVCLLETVCPPWDQAAPGRTSHISHPLPFLRGSLGPCRGPGMTPCFSLLSAPKPAVQPTAHQLLYLQRHSWPSLASSSWSLHADGPLSRGPTPRRAAPLSLAPPHPGSAADPLLHLKKKLYVYYFK